jgi:HAD superfamily hydrolase (TIGR01509 family)
LAFDALFFDFDGLICDTESAARESWRELYTESNVDFPDSVWQVMMGDSGGERIALADLAARRGRAVSPAERAWRQARKSALADAEPLRPGVASCLAGATEAGIVLAVVSSSSLAWVGRHLDRLGVRRWFDFLVTGDLTSRHKPAPDLYRIALRTAKTTAESAVAVEDSVTGVRAARAAGLRCVAVPGSAGRHQDLSAADLVLDRVGLDVLSMEGAT